MEASKRLRNLKYEYIKLSNKLSNIEHHLKEANTKLKKLKEMQSKINRGEKLSVEEIGMIRLSEDIPSFMIRFRLDSELKSICGNIKNFESESALITQAMHNLKICPECGGTGVIKGKTEYVRLEGGVITPSFESGYCEVCEGKGTIDFEGIKESLDILEYEAIKAKEDKLKPSPKRALESLIKEFKEEKT
jgi:hypothetical protein